MNIKLISGTMEVNPNMDGWIITSKSAIAEGNEDMPLLMNDIITINGDVYRDDDLIGNLS